MPVSHLPIMVHAIHGFPELNVSQSVSQSVSQHQQPTSKTRTSKQTSDAVSLTDDGWCSPVACQGPSLASLPLLPLTTTTTTTTRRPVSVSQLEMDNFRS